MPYLIVELVTFKSYHISTTGILKNLDINLGHTHKKQITRYTTDSPPAGVNVVFDILTFSSFE